MIAPYSDPEGHSEGHGAFVAGPYWVRSGSLRFCRFRLFGRLQGLRFCGSVLSTRTSLETLLCVAASNQELVMSCSVDTHSN